VAGEAGGHDAVEHVGTKGDHFQELRGGADTHDVAGFFGGEIRCCGGDGGEHFGLGFADADSADGVAGKIERGEGFGAFAAQMGKSGALNDGEEMAAFFGLAEFGPDIAAGFGPAEGAVDGGADIFLFRGPGRAFVEDHGNVRAEGSLDVHALAGAEENFGAVEVGAKGDAVVGDFAEFGEAENLEAAAVGEDGAVPAHELMEAAEFANEAGAGAEVEVVGVAENDLCADFVELSRGGGFDGGLRADRHEGGGLDRAVGGAEAGAPGGGGGGN